MMQRDFWTTFEFADLINVSPPTFQRRVYGLQSNKPRQIGGTYIIRKYQFFKWYREGGRDILDSAFPKKTIAHHNIESEMSAYYARFIGEGRNCG